MSRSLLSILLIVILGSVQGLQLHGHLELTHSTAVQGQHDHEGVQVHSHLTDPGAAAAHHFESTELDVVGAAGTAYQPGHIALLALLAVWLLILQMLWVCISRWPAPPRPVLFGPPRFLHPTLRAPPA
jgi:hypothetical protein